MNLGDSLLRAAKIKFTDFSQTTIRYETHRPPSTPTLKAPMLETLYGVGDIILRMETEYPTFVVGMSQDERLPYLRANCNLRIHLKDLLHAKTSPDIPKIIFGPAVQGYHLPLFREGHQRQHSLKELEALAVAESVIIGVKEKGSRLMARFTVSPSAFSNLLEGFEKRIRELASAGPLWSQRALAASV